MGNVTAISNPLMQLVQFNGQTYYTGQYFHQMYRNNSDTGGKYKRASDFLRLVRSIEAYHNYIENNDLVEINWQEVKDALAGFTDAKFASVKVKDIGSDFLEQMKVLFRATQYKPIMLINSTAQVALTHHLDDEVSKKASVNANKQTATNQKVLTAFQQAKTAPILLSAYIEAGKILGTSPQMAKAVAVAKVRDQIGIDFEPMLAGQNSVEEVPMTPSKLGEIVNKSGRFINSLLSDNKMQNKKGDEWVPTEKGLKFCSMDPYKARDSGHTGYRPMWHKSALIEMGLMKEKVA